MAGTQDHLSPSLHHIDESPERLDEQHVITTKILGFLLHPNIDLPSSSTLKIADLGTGTGAWLLDVAKTLPSTCQFTGFDMTSSAFPPMHTLPPNVSLKVQDMLLPFPDAELGTYDVVASRFVNSAATRTEWNRAVENITTLLKPGGWIQWIDSCNFTLYNSTPGTSRRACQMVYDGLQPMREKEDLVIGLMMRDMGNARREEVLKDLGLQDVHEDVFSTDRLQIPELDIRDKGTRNIMACYLACLEGLTDADGSTWTKERVSSLGEQAMQEIDRGVYHTLDQVCIIGRKPS